MGHSPAKFGKLCGIERYLWWRLEPFFSPWQNNSSDIGNIDFLNPAYDIMCMVCFLRERISSCTWCIWACCSAGDCMICLQSVYTLSMTGHCLGSQAGHWTSISWHSAPLTLRRPLSCFEARSCFITNSCKSTCSSRKWINTAYHSNLPY